MKREELDIDRGNFMAINELYRKAMNEDIQKKVIEALFKLFETRYKDNMEGIEKFSARQFVRPEIDFDVIRPDNIWIRL